MIRGIEGTRTSDPNVRYIVYGDKVTKLIRIRENPISPQYGLFVDEQGTVFALDEIAGEFDLVTRCGIGIASLPPEHEYTDACRPHDFAYSSPAVQAFKTRQWADLRLYEQLRMKGASKITASVMWALCRVFGIFAWEDSRTR